MTLPSSESDFPTIPQKTSEDMIYSQFMSYRGNKNFEPKKPISKQQFEYSAKFIAISNRASMASNISKGIKTLSIFEGVARVVPTLGPKLKESFKDQFESFFFISLKFIFIDMGSKNSNSKLRNYLKEYFWIKMESMLFEKNTVLQYKWNLGEPMDTYNISPSIYFPKSKSIQNLSKNNKSSKFNYLNYKYLNTQTFESYLEHSLGFKSVNDNQYYIFQGKNLGNNVQNVVRENIYFEELLSVKVEQTVKGSRANNISPFSSNRGSSLEDLANSVVIYSDFVNSVDDLGNSTKVSNVELGEFASFFKPAAYGSMAGVSGVGLIVIGATGGPVGAAVWAGLTSLVFAGARIKAAIEKREELEEKQNFYHEYVDKLGGEKGLEDALNDINEFLAYAKENGIPLSDDLKNQLDANKKYLDSMINHGEDYWIDMQINHLVKTWIWWIPPIPWPWFGKMTRGAWVLAIPIEYKEFPEFDEITLPPTPEVDKPKNPLAIQYQSQWDKFYTWIGKQKFMKNTEAPENNSKIISIGIDQMVKIYDQTKITNLIITQEFITNTDDTIITNNIEKEEITIIKDEEKDKQFVDFVNTDLDQETVNIFGQNYSLEEFSF